MGKFPTLVLLGAASLLACCGGAKTKSEPNSGAAQGAALAVRHSDVAGWTSVNAEVSTVDQAQALARIPGILTSLSVKEGDYVKKGQLIGRVVDSQLGYQSGAYGAQAAAAQAQASQAQAELARTKFLYDNGVYAKARLEQAQSASAAAQAQVRAALAQQQAVGAVAGQGAVLAPTTGRVLSANIPAGSAVAPGMAIATITSGPVVLRLDVPESLSDKLRPGSAVRMETENGETLTGKILRIYPSVKVGQVRADADIAGLDGKLIGRRISAKVDSGTRRAILVPQDYVTQRFGIDYVTIRPNAGHAATVPVQTAPSTEPGKIEILSGVSGGDILVKAAPAGPDI